VGTVELFFDLVFVFAVTQLSHTLLADLSAANALRVLLMMFATWWVWIATSWVTNWLDPERLPVRVGLFVMMLAGLVFSVSIPRAFADRGPAFALAYVFMQLGRTLFFLWMVRDEAPHRVRNFQRIGIWYALGAVFWIVGACAGSSARGVWWALAFLVEFVAPSLYFWVPGLGRSRIEDWDIDGDHFAERCGLFVIIALGESLLVTGATFAGLEWDASALAGFAVAVLGSIALWWIYFDTGAERAHHRIAHARDPGWHARIAYTYLHAFIVAGIVVCAVGDELVLMHPHHAEGVALLVLLAGPALYLFGAAGFKWVTNDRPAPPLSHAVGLCLLALLAALVPAHWFSALGLSAATTAVLLVVATWESVAVRRQAPRGEGNPLARGQR